MRKELKSNVCFVKYVIIYSIFILLNCTPLNAATSQHVYLTPSARIPDTGQTKCYDNYYEIPCPNPDEDFYGQDGNYTINPQSFTKLDVQGNELPDSASEWTMVRDNVTGLIWEVKTDDGSIHDKDNTYYWYDSNPETNGGNPGLNGEGTDTEDFIKSLNDSKYGGFSDWRLPSLNELGGTANYEKVEPSIDTLYFPKTKSACYWSSTSHGTGFAWCFYFFSGNGHYDVKDWRCYVRAVRGGQCRSFDDSVNLVIKNDATVTDTCTGLMWQKEATPLKMTWQNAIDYCKNLSLSNYNDWRLPTVKELMSIANYSTYRPAINIDFFNGNLSVFYWSSTSNAYNTGSAWGVTFNYGYGNSNDKDSSYYVRAVRGGQCRSFGHLVIWTPEQATKWHSGDTMPIKWDTQNISGNVTISISREGGKTRTYIPIASDTPNDGEFEWTVTQPGSVNCMLKIEPVNEPDKGTTQGLFSISPQPPVLTFEKTELNLHHMVQTTFTVSDSDSDHLTLAAFSSDPMLIPDAFITFGDYPNDTSDIPVTPGMPRSFTLTCYRGDKNYGQATITVYVNDPKGLYTSQQLIVTIEPFQPLACENCEITQTMGMVAAGDNHYLALKTDGTVVAWGNNYNGQLGIGNTETKITPVQIQGLSSIVSIQSRFNHNLALRSDGTVWAWGANDYGQLGIGNTISQKKPVFVDTLKNIVAIAAGSSHSLALKADGTVWAWGNCYYEDTSKKVLPIQISSLSNIVTIAAGLQHSLALSSDGVIWSWGANYNGQLGIGSFTDQYNPVQINTINNIQEIAAGDTHNMALHQDGTLYAWGSNWGGQLGNGNTSNQHIPVQVQNISNVVNIECDGFHSFAQLMDGNLMVWGSGYTKHPQLIQKMNDLVNLAANRFSSTIVLTTDGNIKTWQHDYNQNQLPVFKEVTPYLKNIHDITSDYAKTCAVLKDGTVWCWGNSIDGLYGLSSPTPLQLTKLFNITAIESYNVTPNQIVLRNDGKVFGWGWNGRGQLGNGTTEDSSFPIQVPNLDNIISASSSFDHVLCLKQDGSVWAWGDNSYGQLGDGSTTDSYVPIHVFHLDNVISVSTDANRSLALKDDGTVWTWGYSILHDGKTVEIHEPIKFDGLLDIVAIRSGESFSLALKADGTVWTWGNSSEHSSTLKRISNLENIVEIDVAGKSCVARASNGDIWAWGNIWNDYSLEYHYPILIKNTDGISKIKAGFACFYFFMENGTVWMWGYENGMNTYDFFNVCSRIHIQGIENQITDEDVPISIPDTLSNTTESPYTISVLASNPFLIVENEPQVYQNQNQFHLIITPSQNQYGQTKIVVVAEDINGYASSTEFSLTITSINDPPTFKNSLTDITLSEDFTSAITVTVIPDIFEKEEFETITYTLSPDNSALANLQIAPDSGIVTIISLRNACGMGTFSIMANDGQSHNNTAVQSFALTVVCINDPPCFTLSTNSVTAIEDFTDPIHITSNICSMPANESTSLTFTLKPSAVKWANITINSATGEIIITSVKNAYGTETFFVTADDGASENNQYTASFQLTITPDDQPPSIEKMGVWNSFEDQAGNFSFQIVDSESDPSDLSITVNAYCPDLLSSLHFSQNIQVSLQSFSIIPLENQYGICPIAITVTDHLFTVSESFMITINAVDDPPEISNIPDQKITGDILESEIDFRVYDIDSTINNVTCFASSSNPMVVPENHMFINGQGENQHLRIYPTTNDMGNIFITVTAVSNGLTASHTFRLLFNSPPDASDIAISLDEDKHKYIPLSATDSEYDPLTYTIVEYPTHGSLIFSGDVVDYTPFPDYNGMDRFSFKANDGYSDSNIAKVVLTIDPIDDRPVANDLTFQTTENISCALSFPYTDVDGDILRPLINKPPHHGSLSQDLIYTPDSWFWGTDTLIYALSDEISTSVTATVFITVDRANEYTLSVISQNGVGEIEINQTRILLPWQQAFAPDTEIEIMAISTLDRIFNQWIYDQTSVEVNPLIITLDKGKTITAHFVPPTKTITFLGYQSIKINDELYSLPLEKSFYQGDHITVSALPQNLFIRWSGNITGNQNPMDMTIQSDMTIGAQFKDSKEWALPLVAQTIDLSQPYTETISIGVSLLSETHSYQLPDEYGCSLWVYSPDWNKQSQFIQAYNGNQYIWVIGINPHGTIGSPEARTSRLSWNPSHLSDSGYYRMYQGFDQSGEIVIPDMRLTSSYDITGEESVFKFTIVWTNQFETTVHINTQNGWNLISLPVKPLDTSVSHLFPDTLIYAYENGGYVHVTDMQVGKGYWLKTTINGYDLTGESIDAYTITLNQGWHMVGGLAQTVEETFDPGCIEAVFGYQDGAYILVSEFLLGNGYWVKMKKTCEMGVAKWGSDQDKYLIFNIKQPVYPLKKGL